MQWRSFRCDHAVLAWSVPCISHYDQGSQVHAEPDLSKSELMKLYRDTQRCNDDTNMMLPTIIVEERVTELFLIERDGSKS